MSLATATTLKMRNQLQRLRPNFNFQYKIEKPDRFLICQAFLFLRYFYTNQICELEIRSYTNIFIGSLEYIAITGISNQPKFDCFIQS